MTLPTNEDRPIKFYIINFYIIRSIFVTTTICPTVFYFQKQSVKEKKYKNFENLEND